VAALAHDFRSPLAAVLGFVRLAKEDLQAGEVDHATTLLGRIERSASTLEAMLDSVLGSPRTPGAQADLCGVLEQVRAERKRDLERRRIRLLGPEETPLLSVGQADLYRLVSNLVGNAIDHMGNARDAAIRVSLCGGSRHATLRVSDNGVGIPAERREHVFDVAHSRCRSGDTERHRGFGLAIVRELASSWGGRAWVETSPEPGATLCVTIPVAR
jgi:signal transduction histidine kinase